MSGVRGVLSDAIEGYFRALEKDGYRPEGCSADDLADVLLGLGGVAVTQLPEPLRHAMWPLVIGGETEFVTVLHDDLEAPIHISGIGGMDAAEAHTLAAVLLAARAVAEHQDPT